MKNYGLSRISFIGTLLLIGIQFSALSQNTFRYQAVARDSTGATIANQLIGIQVSIIQVDASLPAIYEEEHQVRSNDYGVINLSVGDGIPLLGDFTIIDWSQESFVQIEMDVTGGTNYDLSSLSEILSVPRALYAERAGSISGQKFGLHVKDFGATGDGITDDTEAFERALDSAEVFGAKLFVSRGVYRITRSLIIRDGVSLIGEGTGSDPLQTPYNGSLLWYEGDDFAIKIQGHSSRIKDMVIRDKSNEQALGGILLQADGRLLESVFLNEVLISGFVNGTGLKLVAENHGGIAYASFYNVRVRHGKIGIHIDPTNNSFINSNTWYHCQISGGGFDYGTLVDGGNNNVFHNLVIEPPSTTKGHMVVNKGEVISSETRIEGYAQSPGVPFIKLARHTKNSMFTGIYAGGLTLDLGNNFINMKSGKTIHYRNSSFNRFRNATFFSPSKSVVKDWDISGNGVTIDVLPPELTEFHNVLALTIPAGSTAKVEASVLARPQIKALPIYDQVNFGFHMKTEHPDIAFTVANALQGWTSSAHHSGSGEWEFVGMNAEINRDAPPRFMAQIDNTTGSEITVYLCTPTLNFGNQLPTLDEAPLFSSGGELTGMLTHAAASSDVPNNGFLSLPLSANYFEITSTKTIHRINHLTADRAPKGTIFTLLFDNGGVDVTNSAYLNLKSGFTSVVNGSITLMSNGNGTWREVNRNN